MTDNYTLLFLLQHSRVSSQIHILPCNDVSTDTDVAAFLNDAEQQASESILSKIHAFAAESLQNRKCGHTEK
jgi:hypothetical protein